MTASARPTLREVAAEAGVSLKTASRALNDEPGVAPATAERVAEAARRLGFRPNLLASSLRSGRPSAMVGLALPNIADPFFAQVVGAVEGVLAPRGLLVATTSHGEDAARQRIVVRDFVDRRVTALLLAPAPGDAGYLSREIGHGMEVVALDRPLAGADVDTVVVDNRAASASVVHRYAAQGHRRIALLCHDLRPWTMAERLAGYRDGLAAAGLPEDPALMLLSGDEATARAAVARMLALPDPPTAIFAAHNDQGRAAIRAMRNAGREVPLTVFDEVADPDLLIRVPDIVASGPVRLGTVAAQMLLERIDGLATPARYVELPTTVTAAERVLA